MTNFTAGHETRWGKIGEDRLAYPPNHIEVDNRLSWYLGRLDKKYGDNAVYVHLTRDPDQVAASYNRRWTLYAGIIPSYARGIALSQLYDISVCYDYIDTVEENIELFLRDKSRVYRIDIAEPHEVFKQFWNGIGAQGDLEKALEAFEHKFNASAAPAEEAEPIERTRKKLSETQQKFRKLDKHITRLEQEKRDLRRQLRLLRKKYDAPASYSSFNHMKPSDQNGDAVIVSTSPPSSRIDCAELEERIRADAQTIARMEAELHARFEEIATLTAALESLNSSFLPAFMWRWRGSGRLLGNGKPRRRSILARWRRSIEKRLPARWA